MYTAYVAFVKDLKRNKSDVVKNYGPFFLSHVWIINITLAGQYNMTKSEI